MFFIQFAITLVILFCAFQGNASDAVDLDKFWEKAVSRSTPASTQTQTHTQSLRTEEVSVQGNAPKYVLFFDYADNICANFKSLEIARLGRCIRYGNSSRRLSVSFMSNGTPNPDIVLMMTSYKDTSCKKMKSADATTLPPLDMCAGGVKFSLSDSFPDGPPAGTWGAVLPYYSSKSECRNDGMGNPYYVQIFANGCMDGDSPAKDLKVTGCSNSKGISYHTYPSTKGTCSGKLAKKTFNKKCENKDLWGQTTNGYVDFFCM